VDKRKEKKKKFKKIHMLRSLQVSTKLQENFFFFLKSLSCQTLSLLAKKFHFSPEKLSLFSRKISPSPELSLF
jgi:hypothetical protein